MHRLLQHAWQLLARVWRWSVGTRRDPLAPTLQDLPDAAAAALLTFLDASSIRTVALWCRDPPPPLVEAFQRRFVLRLPPDAPRNELLMRAITRHGQAADPPNGQHDNVAPLCATANQSSESRSLGRQPPMEEEPAAVPESPPLPLPLLSTQFAVADMDHAADLLPLSLHVRGLVVSSNEYTAWPERPFYWNVLLPFVRLERLVLDHVWDRPLDLTLLSQNVPHLQELVVKLAWAVTGQLTGLPRLRVLHLEDTNIDSFATALGLPTLQSLTLIPSTLSTATRAHDVPLCDVACLANVAPLRRLVVRGLWQACPREAVRAHHATLREYAERRDTRLFSRYNQWQPDWPTMTHLRSLQLGRFKQIDTTPLAELVALEELQVVVADACEHCVPLRRLTRLRELHITRGWMCDLVGYLPRLERLVWEGFDSIPYNDARRMLWCRYRRDHDQEPNPHHEAAKSSLRQLVLHGDLYISDAAPSVRQMLQHVEQLEVSNNFHAKHLFQWIARLRYLKRLAFRHCYIPWVRHARDRLVSLACAESLEELYVMPRGGAGRAHTPAAPLPQWFHNAGLPNLRVLASPLHESMAVLGVLCPRLTHVHIPVSAQCAFPTTNRASLSRLCVVSLAISEDCTWLRCERGPGRALPSLQRIFHPTTDCLISPQCCQRDATLGQVDLGWYDMFVSEKMLRAPWGHAWETVSWRMTDDQYHRVQPVEGR